MARQYMSQTLKCNVMYTERQCMSQPTKCNVNVNVNVTYAFLGKTIRLSPSKMSGVTDLQCAVHQVTCSVCLNLTPYSLIEYGMCKNWTEIHVCYSLTDIRKMHDAIKCKTSDKMFQVDGSAHQQYRIDQFY